MAISKRKTIFLVPLGMIFSIILVYLVCALPVLADPLHDAVEKGDLAEVKRLVAAGGDVNEKDSEGRTALFNAVSNGQRDMVELLIEKGANVNVKDRLYGVTPLHWAAAQGLLEIVKLLVEKGADVNAQTKIGETPHDFAVKDGHKTVVKFLESKGAAASSEHKLGLTDDMRSASELIDLCTSTDPDKLDYCHGYIEGAINSWKVQTACASRKRSDQQFCAGAKAAYGPIKKGFESLPRDSDTPQEDFTKFKNTLGTCTPGKKYNQYYCMGYNAEAANTIADLSKRYPSRVSISARDSGLGRASSDEKLQMFVSAEFLTFRPCVNKEMTPEKGRKILLDFIRKNPEQQINMSAVMMLERALFFDYCPGPTLRHMKPHLENCITWTSVDGKSGIKNSCEKPVVIEFISRYGADKERGVIPANSFGSDPRLSSKPGIFAACLVGYVSFPPFTEENYETIRTSVYVCVRE